MVSNNDNNLLPNFKYRHISLKKGDIMAHKTFISYKYSEAKDLRDNIIQHLGEDAKFYKGETADSPNLTDETTEKIRKYLKDLIYDTSVMIVIISPNMKDCSWIDWEVEYALKNIKHEDRTSHSNGILGVIMNDPDEKWFRNKYYGQDGDENYNFNTEYVYDIISKNRSNQNPKEYSCEACKTISPLTGSYISFVTEDDFLSDPNLYINNAFDKSQKLDNYDITKIINKNHITTL